MAGRPLVRILVAGLLLLSVAGMAVDYAASADERTVYPSEEHLEEHYERFHGQEVRVWLVVAEVGDGQFSGGGWQVRVDPVPASVDEGDSVQVVGTARPGTVIEARELFVTERTNKHYMYAVSAIAVLLTAAVTLRHWRPSVGRLALVPRREDP